MILLRLLLYFSLLIFSLQLSSQDADLVIKNVLVFDGTAMRPNMDVAVKDGKIMAVSTHPSNLSGRKVVEGEGHSLVPGLMNAHVHAWFPAHLQEAARAGVLTVLDMHGSLFSFNFLRNLRDSSGYARYYGAGGGLTVPGGHGTQFGLPTPTVDSNTTARQFVIDRANEGVDYLKILREPSRPTVTKDQMTEAIATAREHSLMAVSHISRLEDALLLNRLGADGLVHLWFDEIIDAQQLDSLAQGNMFIVPTLLTNMGIFPIAVSQGWDRPIIDSIRLLNEAAKLHQAGIKLLAGTDPPNFGINYGDDLIKELELLVAAGLSPAEALRCATSNVAEAFGLTELGNIAEGKLADILLVEGDISQNISQLRTIKHVWKAGQLVE